jgi:hypothetical protein
MPIPREREELFEQENAMGQSVCEGAVLRCNQGQSPATLHVTFQDVVMLHGKKVATVHDSQPSANIPPFGICQFLTAAALGAPTPCSPAPAGPWTGAPSCQQINGLQVLTTEHICSCGIGGMITVEEPANKCESES